MSTIQIVGIAAAAVVVLLLVIALVVTRKSGDERAEGAGEAETGGSFLDDAPSDTLAKLGRPEHVPAEGGSGAAEAPAMMAAAGAAADDALGLDWDRDDDTEPPVADETETTGEIPAVAAEPVATEPATDEPPTAEEEPVAEEAPAAAPVSEEEPAAERQPAPTAEASDNLVPLSSIIVTTSTKMVDLNDPEIRRMLTDLVTFEMDQATQFREQGQTIDAVLQLTEAEKICTALGKLDMAREIRAMMRGLKA
jgi:hypothetical protein